MGSASDPYYGVAGEGNVAALSAVSYWGEK